MRKDLVYKAKRFDLSGLKGISDRTLEMHFKLYEGYVANTNMLNERIGEFLEKGPISQAEMPVYSELTRRLGFEYNGMVLHEHYFGNLMKNGSGGVTHNSAFFRSAEQGFGSFDLWKAHFVNVGKMRGVGWAICYQDPASGRLSNHWITLHEDGNVAGCDGECFGRSLSLVNRRNSVIVPIALPPTDRARSATSSTTSFKSLYCASKNLWRSLNWGPTTFQW